MHWYAVQITARHENKIKKYLDKQKANGLAERVGRVVAYDAFPGYIFIEADMWPELYLHGMTTRHRVMGQISEAEVMLAEAAAKAPKPAPFKPGDQVKILHGPLENLHGLVQQAGPERSKVVVTFFNDKVAAEVENQHLQAN